MNKNKTVLIITATVFIVIVGAYFVWQNLNSSASNNGIIIYPIQCEDWTGLNIPPLAAQNFQNCLKRRALSRLGFKVNKEDHQVLQWFPDSSLQLISNNNCTIVDQNTWTCASQVSVDYSFGFNNGKPFRGGSEGVIFVTKEQWDSINNGAPTP